MHSEPVAIGDHPALRSVVAWERLVSESQRQVLEGDVLATIHGNRCERGDVDPDFDRWSLRHQDEGRWREVDTQDSAQCPDVGVVPGLAQRTTHDPCGRPPVQEEAQLKRSG